MSARNEVSEIRDRFTEDSGEPGGQGPKRPLGDALLVLTAALVVVLALGILFAGCGQHDDSTSASATSSSPRVASDAGRTQVASAVAVPSAAVGGTRSQTVANDSTALQPDFDVAVIDTLVQPGQVLEFTAQGTADLTSLTLSDGRDRPVAMLREPGGGAWHAQYRVPLRPRHERFGVSLTGRNEAGRWRRAWVFLHVASAADSSEDDME
jgi:hypothetical protein